VIRNVVSRPDVYRFPVDPWRLVELEPSTEDLGLTETLFAVGNGYLGMRGNPEEGREAHSHGTFLNGFHETWPIQHAEEAFGFARVGQTLVNAPDAKLIKLYVNDEPLLVPEADLDEYERVLDFRTGMLTRSLVWRTPSGKRVLVRSSRLVSFEDRHLAVMTLEVTLLDGPAPVVISSQLLNRQDGEDEYHVRAAALGEGELDPRRARGFNHRVLQPVEQRVVGDRVILGYRTTRSGLTLACGFDHVIDTECGVQTVTTAGDDVGKTVATIEADRDQPIRLVKYVTYHTSRGVPPKELADRCSRTLNRALSGGYYTVVDEQREWLDAWWDRCDVQIDGDDALQQAVRFSLFHLAQASARSDRSGVPAKGVTGLGYEGHYFWDTEIYVVPFLAYTSPHLARNLLRFRYLMLPKARERATELNQQGALFPWRTIDGNEASAYYQAGTAQYHINADVMHALKVYVQATGDEDLLKREGAEMLVETARLWCDLGFHRASEGAFHIHGVTGPDEYTAMVNDNLFTNVMARFNLRYAADTVDWLRKEHPADHDRLVAMLGLTPDELAEWRRAADAMYVGYDEELGIHPQDDSFIDKEPWDFESTPPDHYPLLLHYHPLVIYRLQVLKQADVVMAMWLAGEHFTPEQKRSNFEYYDAITTADSSLSPCVQAIIAAEVGEMQLAEQYLKQAAYLDLGDGQANTADGAHVASMGGVWAALVYGFGGMRDHNGAMSFDPRMNGAWEALRFSLMWRGRQVEVEIRHDRARFTLRSGEPMPIEVRGTEHRLTTDEPLVVELTPD
jgi:alpha,alpha-trehalose phosphorylase